MKRVSLDLPDEKAAWVRNELDDGEQVTWSGAPRPRYFSKQALPQFLFAIPWTLFAIFWIASAAAGASPTGGIFAYAFPAFGLPFVFIGFGMLSAPIWSRLRLVRTAYVVTDRRAIVIEHDIRNVRSVRSFAPSQLGTITKSVHADGSGDVLFTEDVATRGRNGTYRIAVGFFGVAAPREAELALRALAAPGAITDAT